MATKPQLHKTLPAKPFVSDKPPILDINANRGEDDPEMPYSGGSSSAFVNDSLIQPEAEKQKRAAKQQRSDLLPVAQDIFEFLNSERAAIADLRAYIKTLGDNPSKEALMDEYRARELYLNYLQRFEQWMINRLSKTPANKVRR